MRRNNSLGKKKVLDQVDCRMIELLQKDGRISNTDLAKEIGISEATVKLHISNVLTKLGVLDRTQAAIEAVRQGIVHLDT